MLTAVGGVDAAIVTAATPTAVEQAYRSLKRGGRLVLVGLPAQNTIELPIFQTVLNGITVVGSIVGTRRDLAEVFELPRRRPHSRGVGGAQARRRERRIRRRAPRERARPRRVPHGVAAPAASISERATTLIGVAHPEFRDELTAQARGLSYL